MTTAWPAVLAKIAGMFLVMLAGWLARRRNWFSSETASALGRFTIDVAFPALTFNQMVTSVNAGVLKSNVPLFVAALTLLALSFFIAFLSSYAFSPARARPSFVFLGGMPNWIFLPLAIVPALVGEVGTHTVLLFNIPAQVFLWTAGMWVVRGGLRGSHSFRHLFENPGLVATLVGIVIGCTWTSAPKLVNTAPGQALGMLAALTVPLSLVVTGAQMGDVKFKGAFDRPLAGILVTRLLVAPLILAVLIGRAPWFSPDVKIVLHVIACMPVGASCALFLERFGGDVGLAAKAITLSTLLSLVTLPVLLFWMI